VSLLFKLVGAVVVRAPNVTLVRIPLNLIATSWFIVLVSTFRYKLGYPELLETNENLTYEVTVDDGVGILIQLAL
jgi:hypothetical protein